jgi:mannose-6-phosphate isomerase-like protein (cupin superfamily)
VQSSATRRAQPRDKFEFQARILLGLGDPQPEEPQVPASIAELATWASHEIEDREPDQVIRDGRSPDDYLRRWYLIPHNRWMNLYLHQFLRSDDDRALHDHPWDNTSLILQGRYIEHTPTGQVLRQPGDCITRAANALHRIELIGDQPVITLFATGPKVREWGFDCPGGWVHWKDFDQRGGCGEPHGEAAPATPLPSRPDTPLCDLAEAVIDAVEAHLNGTVELRATARRSMLAKFADLGLAPHWVYGLREVLA